MMQLYGDVISERYKHKIQFLPIPVENEHFTQKNMSNSSACASAASSQKCSIYRQNALKAAEGTKRHIVDTELFYNYGFHVGFLR